MDTSYYKKYEPIFGKWHIVKELGEGSYGKVFEIEREDFGYTYKAALKAVTIPQSQSEVETIMDDGMDSESVTTYFRGFVEELIEEFRLMSKLKGESNIVSYEDHQVIAHEDGIGWDVLIRMELLTPLLRYTKANALGQAEVINLGIDICKALELCRKHDIVHRDIKPENIFVSENGSFKLGDFGIAKTVEKTMGGLSKKGTYTYMAPEVYKGEEYGPSVDIYSLGIVLYRYLNNNRAPFLPEYPALITHTDRMLAIDRRIKGEAIPAPANADNELAAIILKACAYNPKDRYSSPAEMREDLEAVAAGVTPAHLAALGATLLPDEEETVRENPSSADIANEETVKDDVAEDEKTTGVFGAFAGAVHKNAAEKRAVETLESEVPKKEPEPVSKEVKTKKKSKKEPEAKEKNESKRKTPFIIAAAALLAIVVGIIAFGGGGKPEAQADWTAWEEELPIGVTDEDYVIEKATKYRSRDKETKTSTKSDKMDGWKLEETAESGEFGAWSDWSTTAVTGSETREVESETRYRSRKLETTTSSNSSMSGWELTDTTYSWSDYGPWSSWQTASVSSSDSRKVETKTQYSYRTKSTSQQYSSWSGWSGWQDNSVSSNDLRKVETRTVYMYCYFQCAYCGNHWHGYGFPCYTWGGGCGQGTIQESSYHEVWGTTPQSQMNWQDWHGTGHTYAYYNGERVFRNIHRPNASKTQYRYATRTISDVTTYSDWSSYSDTYQSSSSTKEVRTRTMYRYCDRTQVPTYHFQRWGSWSSWTTQAINSSSTRQIESSTFYRYRDKVDETTYIFYRWSDWSDWSETPIEETDSNEVEKKIVYRYKSK
ncbi:MAG: serine/threonine-protein kinase [Oscillospiraceae bacterium]|nr:serine/threonine-protein kinase [Oscillospiraceae bacterium]